MSDLLTALIDKQDGYEIIRDTVAVILTEEVANQVALATAAGKQDPQQWFFEVYTERSNPFQIGRDEDGKYILDKHFVNIHIDTSHYNKGNHVERQTGELTINIDCFSTLPSKTIGGDFTSADYRASLDAERIARLVRNILMSAKNSYLRFNPEKVVNPFIIKRWVDRIQKMQPDRSDRPQENFGIARVELKVEYNETSPQITGDVLEQIGIQINRDDTGQVYASVEIDNS